MNTLELSNVELSVKVAKSINESSRELKNVDKLIDPVVQRLAVLNPLWRFVVESTQYDNSTEPQSLKATEFKVMEAGEELGTISKEYHGRSYVIQISNERIGFSLFLEHIKTMAESEQNTINRARDEHDRLSEEMLTIDKVKSQFEKGKTALVIKDDGKYLVKIGDAIQLYDDNTLPDDMRGKLGMLKLVEAEAFVSNTGCRINDEVFVLVVEEA
jgi:hypothetical protein